MLHSVTFVPFNGSGTFSVSGGTADLYQLKIGGTVPGGSGTINLSASSAVYLGSGGLAPNLFKLAGHDQPQRGTRGPTRGWSSSVPMNVGGRPPSTAAAADRASGRGCGSADQGRRRQR